MNIIHWKLNSFININKHCYFEELFLLNVRFPYAFFSQLPNNLWILIFYHLFHFFSYTEPFVFHN